jgi:hypothetical protein
LNPLDIQQPIVWGELYHYKLLLYFASRIKTVCWTTSIQFEVKNLSKVRTQLKNVIGFKKHLLSFKSFTFPSATNPAYKSGCKSRNPSILFKLNAPLLPACGNRSCWDSCIHDVV